MDNYCHGCDCCGCVCGLAVGVGCYVLVVVSFVVIWRTLALVMDFIEVMLT